MLSSEQIKTIFIYLKNGFDILLKTTKNGEIKIQALQYKNITNNKTTE